MIPIRDDNPVHSTPYVTVGLIVVNCLVFLLEIGQPGDGMNAFIWKWGFVPAQLTESKDAFVQRMSDQRSVVQATDARGRPLFDRSGRPIVVERRPPVEEATALPAWLNIVTCMFLHGGWMHLIGNMLYLWIFGNNIEDRLGPVLFVIFYLATGVAGNMAHTWREAGLVPLVGASGAISGVMGAYVLLFPRAQVLTIVPAGWYWFTMKLPAWIFLGIYIVIQNVFPAYFGREDGVAYMAHIGGFASGIAFIYLFPHRKLPTDVRKVRYRVIDDDDADIVL